MVGIKHESMRKGQTSHKKEHNTRMCFPLKPVFTRDKGELPNFMDEPTAGLDVQARNDVLDILREYMAEDENRSIIITSHISSDIENLCDDVYLINDGRIILHEDTDTIVEQYGIVKVKEEQYEKLDKNYILKTKKECYGYACFVSSKAFYKENYPDITVENGGIDELILMMAGGDR